MNKAQKKAQTKFKEDYSIFSKLKMLFSKTKAKAKKYTMIMHYKHQ